MIVIERQNEAIMTNDVICDITSNLLQLWLVCRDDELFDNSPFGPKHCTMLAVLLGARASLLMFFQKLLMPPIYILFGRILPYVLYPCLMQTVLSTGNHICRNWYAELYRVLLRAGRGNYFKDNSVSISYGESNPIVSHCLIHAQQEPSCSW